MSTHSVIMNLCSQHMKIIQNFHKNEMFPETKFLIIFVDTSLLIKINTLMIKTLSYPVLFFSYVY